MAHVPPPADNGFPDTAALAALRGWYAGMDARQAVNRYLSHKRVTGQSSRALLTGVRKQLIAFATRRHRADLAKIFEHSTKTRLVHARTVLATIDSLRHLPEPAPLLGDALALWVPARAATVLERAGLRTLADVAPRTLLGRRWWLDVPGLGVTSARRLEASLAQMPSLMRKAAENAVQRTPAETAPWERLDIPLALNGALGTYRAPIAGCTLAARTDYEAVNAWMELLDTPATIRAYRKEVERLTLWALLERNKSISSLSLEDATAYRAFLKNPTPRDRWVGPPALRQSSEWRPFRDGLSPRSAAYSLSVINALFRWLKEQNYLLANPFAGLKVRGAGGAPELEVSRALTRHEWALVRIEADLVESRHGWLPAAGERLRFLLDFWLATGLRPSEFVGATLANVDRQVGGDSWLHVRGKGDKPARVALPLLATGALERYLAQRRLPVSPELWAPHTVLLPDLKGETGPLTTARVWAVLKRFFMQAATALAEVNPALSEKLRRVSPHWLRHTHATLALASGVSLKSVRDNLRHASIATTTVYLDAEDVQRAKELHNAFRG